MCKIKFIILGIVAIVFNSCVSIPMPTYEKNAFYVDYSQVSAVYGVFLTEATSVNFDYDPIGSIEVTELSGVITSEQIVEQVDDIYGKSTKTVKKGEYLYASTESVVSTVAKLAKEKGGDGIINLKIKYVFQNDKPGYSISGMVIKRNLQ